jgi:hypothetical protein
MQLPTEQTVITLEAYYAARYAALSLPLIEMEQTAEQRAAEAMGKWLALGQSAAGYYARRSLLYQREVRLHEALVLSMPPAHIPEILDEMKVMGFPPPFDVEGNHGVLLVSLHYNLYSSLLIWWLARATVQGHFNSLTVLMRSTDTGQYFLSDQRIAEFESVGVWSRSKVTLLDRTALGSPVAARDLLRRLNSGGAVLVFTDAWLMPPGDRSLTVRVGQKKIGLPRGVAWLGQMSGTLCVPVYIRPHGEQSHAVGFGPAVSFRERDDAASVAESALQYVVDQTIGVDPSPWEGWLREGLVSL